ncbi:MAG: DNRLRE domain-containing protein [Polyangiaceae bacterium]
MLGWSRVWAVGLLCVLLAGCSSGDIDSPEPVDALDGRLTLSGTTDSVDTYLLGASGNDNTGTLNAGASLNLCVGRLGTSGGNSNITGLLKFNLPTYPPGATVQSAQLSLFPAQTGAGFSAANRVRIRRLTSANFSEGNGVGAGSGTDGGCQGSAGTGSTLATYTPTGDMEVFATPTVNTPMNVTVTSIVQTWVTSASANRGFLITRENNPAAQDVVRFRSSESANPPTLTITLQRGSPCNSTSQCNGSDQCVEGVCCNTSCGGTCQSCLASKSTSATGTCGNIDSRTDPDNECTHTCNGAGACGTGCNNDTDCASTHWCSGNVCTLKGAVGDTCSANNQCANGQCVDQRCCSTSSCPTCQACRANITVGSDGTCANIDPFTDPFNECSPGSCNGGACTTSCTSDSQCNADHYCSSSSGGTCQPDKAAGSVCSGDTIDATGAHQCATGNCVDGRCCTSSCTTPCRSCANTSGTCTTVVSNQDDPGTCSGAVTCNAGGQCLPTNGSTCTQDSQCSSGQCEDGFCCNADCGDSNPGDCRACNVVGSQGTCSAVPAGSVTCRASTGVCDVAEQCDGASMNCPANAFDSTTQCRAASCSAGTETLAATCNGTGANCPTIQTNACAPYVCGATACQTNCTSDAQCTSTNWCNGTSCVSKFTNGTACTEARQCSSNLCVDGVCCNAACNGQCEACDVTGSVGTCSPVSGAPHGARTACAGDGSVCNGQCDGANRTACGFAGGTTQCRAPQCNNGQSVIEAFCDGVGNCPSQQQQTCDPYRCSATVCLTTCTTDTQCQTGFRCDAGACVPAKTNGETCGGDTECASGFCVDGFCCNAPCNGQCEACSVSGSEGTCTEVTGAPVGTRPSCADDGSVCGGTCNGVQRAACAYPGGAEECRAADCMSGTATLSATCDGAGSCPAIQTLACPTGNCAGTLCEGNCTVDGDCSAGAEYCAAGVCTPNKGNGEQCSRDSMCVSGRCVDGYCCNSACDGQCEACNVTGSEGVCSAVTGAPRGARPACSTDGTACAGTCDGVATAACAYPGSSTVCRNAACSAGVATLEGHCTGGGSCSPLQQQTCSPFICHATDPRCDGDCSGDTDCSGGQYCAGGVCVDPQPPGAACSSTAQCASGFCVDGVCCDTACNGQCEACNEAGFVGTCSPVTGTPRNGRASCGGTGVCAGACDGTSGACSYPGGSTVCGVGSCSSGIATPAAACNGNGSCLNGLQTSCAPYLCSGTTCASTCTDPSECTTGFDCVNGSCESIGVGGAGGMAGTGGLAGAAGAGGTTGGAGGVGGATGGSAGVGLPDAGVTGGTAGANGLIEGVDEGSTCRVAAPGSDSRRSSAPWLLLASGLAFVAVRRRRSLARRV